MITTTMIQSISAHPQIQPVVGISTIAGIEFLFPFFALQKSFAGDSLILSLPSCPAWLVILCFIYSVILSVFRAIFFENGNVFHSFLQVCFCGLLAFIRYHTYMVPDSMRISAEWMTSIAASYFVYSMHSYYVCGRKYSSSNMDGKVTIITGSNTGKCHFLLTVPYTP